MLSFLKGGHGEVYDQIYHSLSMAACPTFHRNYTLYASLYAGWGWQICRGSAMENNHLDPFLHTSQAKGQVRLQLFFVPNMNRTEPDAKEPSTPVVDLAGGTGIKEILSSGKASSLRRL